MQDVPGAPCHATSSTAAISSTAAPLEAPCSVPLHESNVALDLLLQASGSRPPLTKVMSVPTDLAEQAKAAAEDLKGEDEAHLQAFESAHTRTFLKLTLFRCF